MERGSMEDDTNILQQSKGTPRRIPSYRGVEGSREPRMIQDKGTKYQNLGIQDQQGLEAHTAETPATLPPPLPIMPPG